MKIDSTQGRPWTRATRAQAQDPNPGGPNFFSIPLYYTVCPQYKGMKKIIGPQFSYPKFFIFPLYYPIFLFLLITNAQGDYSSSLLGFFLIKHGNWKRKREGLNHHLHHFSSSLSSADILLHTASDTPDPPPSLPPPVPQRSPSLQSPLTGRCWYSLPLFPYFHLLEFVTC